MRSFFRQFLLLHAVFYSSEILYLERIYIFLALYRSSSWRSWFLRLILHASNHNPNRQSFQIYLPMYIYVNLYLPAHISPVPVSRLPAFWGYARTTTMISFDFSEIFAVSDGETSGPTITFIAYFISPPPTISISPPTNLRLLGTTSLVI